MNQELSPNTQAILLLTAPLLAGRQQKSSEQPLTFGEYKRLAARLRDLRLEPADLLGADASSVLTQCQDVLDGSRMQKLLERGFLLSQAVERWQTRAIWVVSRADFLYPARYKKTLKDNAPPVLYGCGDAALLDSGGLAVVGSRNVDDDLVAYTRNIGSLAAQAQATIISGGARGIDQASMRGSLDHGGRAVGILADRLERAALSRENREALLQKRLVLVSPYDPLAGFNVGNAMQRNKLIYALADAALVVNADLGKGGTWAGATEQIEKLKLVPVYVRSVGDGGNGLAGLKDKGALPWPEPLDAASFAALLSETKPLIAQAGAVSEHFDIPRPETDIRDEEIPDASFAALPANNTDPTENVRDPAKELPEAVRKLLQRTTKPRTDVEIAAELGVSKGTVQKWLQDFVKQGFVKKLSKPVRYQIVKERRGSLFDSNIPANNEN